MQSSTSVPPSLPAAFHALVEEYVAGYPVRGHMLSSEDVRFVAGKLLLRKSRVGAASQEQPQPETAAPKLAACLFVLFVQEHLMHSQPAILGASPSGPPQREN